MELKIEKDTFYLLNTGNGKQLHDTDKSAIQSLKQVAASDKGMNPEKVSIMKVNTSGDKWQVASVPWSEIAIGLIREE